MEKSIGHLGFAGDFEFYKRGLSVYKAKISSPFIEGHREFLEWYCPTYLWKNYQWIMDGEIGIAGIYLHAEIAAQQSVHPTWGRRRV